MSWSSGTNSIQEVDTNKSMTLQMIKLKKQGGGTEYFVRKNDVKLGTKHITQNGTYPASNDGKLGFSQVTVNVRGGSGSADSHGKPTGGDIKPGGSGSAVVGTDPETGNDVVVGVDEDDNLVKTPLPSSIVLVTPPTKTDYNDGETIDLSGAVVVAKMADGSTWTDADHPNGHVSCTPEPAAADKSQASKDSSATSSLYNQPIYFQSQVTIGNEHGLRGGDGVVLVIAGDTGGIMYIYAFSKTPGTIYGLHYGEVTSTAILSETITVQEHTFYYKYYFSWPLNSFTEGICNQIDNFDYGAGNLGYTVLFGEISESGTQEIALNWARPGDGKVLSTTMEINVGAHTTESSSGTEGSGGGGTF